MKKKLVKVIGSIFCIAFVASLLPLLKVEAKVIVDKTSGKKYELVESKEALAETFREHAFNLDKSFKIYVSSDVVKNFPKEFEGIWKLISKDTRFGELWHYNTEYKSVFKNYSKTKAKCWEWNITSMKFSISKAAASRIKKDEGVVISSMNELVNAFSTNIQTMNDFFSLKISKKVIKNIDKDYKKVKEKIYKIPEISNILRYIEIEQFPSYDYKNYWKWNVTVDYKVSKITAKEIKDGKDFHAKTYAQLTKMLSDKVKRHDTRIILKVDHSVLDFNDAKAYEKLWNDLLLDAKFKSVFEKKKNYSHKLVSYDKEKYREWIIDIKY